MPEENPQKSVVFLNHTKNPQIVMNSDNKKVLVAIGESVEVIPAVAAQLRKVVGFVDASKYQKPSSEVDALKKDLAESKQKCAVLEKENADLKEKLKKAR